MEESQKLGYQLLIVGLSFTIILFFALNYIIKNSPSYTPHEIIKLDEEQFNTLIETLKEQKNGEVFRPQFRPIDRNEPYQIYGDFITNSAITTPAKER